MELIPFWAPHAFLNPIWKWNSSREVKKSTILLESELSEYFQEEEQMTSLLPPHPTPHPHPRLQEKSWKVRKVRKQLERYRWRVAECWSFLMLGDGDMRFYFSALFIFNIFDISIFLNKVFFKRVDCKYELEGPNRRWLCARGKCKCYFQNLKMAREPSISLGLLRLSLQARLA